MQTIEQRRQTRIHDAALQAFGPEMAQEWLNRPSRYLHNRTPGQAHRSEADTHAATSFLSYLMVN